MKNALILGFMFCGSLSCFADVFLPKVAYQNFKCQKEAEKVLRVVFAENEPKWERVADADFETQAFRAPTSKTGEWYEFHISENNTPELFFYSLAKTSTSQWTKSCKLLTKQGPGFEFFKAAPGDKEASFTDQDLAKLIHSKKNAVIYLWSPRMVYSVTEFARLRAVIEKRKMEFVPVLDPMVETAEARAAMKKAGVELGVKIAALSREPSSVSFYKRLSSVDLYMRNGTLHFPTMFVVSKGKIHPRRIVGILSDDGLNKSLDEWMAEIK